jgi:hypothetical protein
MVWLYWATHAVIQQRRTIDIRTRPGGPEALWSVPNVRTKKKIGKKYPIEAPGV